MKELIKKAEEDITLFQKQMEEKYKPIIENAVKEIGIRAYNTQYRCAFLDANGEEEHLNKPVDLFVEFLCFLESSTGIEFLFNYENGHFEWL